MLSTNDFSGPDDGYEPDADSVRNLVEKFESLGGDKRFLEFLKNYPQSPIPKPRSRRQVLELKRRGGQLAKLHGELKRDPLFAADPRIDELRLIAETISRLKSFRGAPIKRPELYFWLAALVPYTLYATGETRWSWIGEWVNEITGQDLFKPQVYWGKVIEPKARSPILPLELKSTLHHGAMAYREWLELGKPLKPHWRRYRPVSQENGLAREFEKHLVVRRKIWNRQPSAEERRYDQVVSLCLPVLGPLFKIPFPSRLRVRA